MEKPSVVVASIDLDSDQKPLQNKYFRLVNEMSADSDQRLEYLYREYVRLSDKAEDFIRNTYDDFKMFGAVSAVIVIWKPIAELITPENSQVDSSLILFLGFLILEFVVEANLSLSNGDI